MLLLSHSGLEKRKRRLFEASIFSCYSGSKDAGVFLSIAVGCSSDAGVGDDAVCSPSPLVT